MSKTYRQQFDEALACETKEQAGKWFADEVRRYETDFGKSAEEARTIIRANLGYMAGYYDAETAKKVAEMYGANHPIFGGSDYHGKITAEQALRAGASAAKDIPTV